MADEKTSAEQAAEKLIGLGDETPAEETEEAAPVEETPAPEEPADESEKPTDDRPKREDGTVYTQADIDGLQAALKAARKDARTHKADLDSLREKGGDRPLDEVLSEAASAADAKWKPLMVRAAARAAFAEAGLSLPEGRQDEALARAVRLLDEDTLTISDTGTVEGLAEQVESIRTDFPDLFAGQQKSRPRIQAADKPAGPKPTPTAADRLAAQLLGGVKRG